MAATLDVVLSLCINLWYTTAVENKAQLYTMRYVHYLLSFRLVTRNECYKSPVSQSYCASIMCRRSLKALTDERMDSTPNHLPTHPPTHTHTHTHTHTPLPLPRPRPCPYSFFSSAQTNTHTNNLCIY
jgi:hypothetical protein